MESKRSLTTIVILMLSFLSMSFGTEPRQTSADTVFDLMYQETPLEVNIFTDFVRLDSLRNTNEYQAATFSFLHEKMESKWGIKIRARGKYRRRICNQAPLKLNFDKDQLKERGLKKDDELKLVTQCIPGNIGRDYVMREFLVYKLYNILSPTSFRVQLVELRLNCTSSGDLDRSWGIIIEDENTLARRLNAEVCEDCYGTDKMDFDQPSLKISTLFQYMIGNTDYNLLQSRNIKILKEEAAAIQHIAPYDFDFSGIVNASYAIPSSDYKQASVRDRIFLGHSTDAELADTIEYFQSKKTELLSFIENFKLLSRSSRRDIQEYIYSFYDSLEEGIVRPE